MSEEELKIQIFDRDFNIFCDMESISELIHLSQLKSFVKCLIKNANENTKLKADEGIITDSNL